MGYPRLNLNIEPLKHGGDLDKVQRENKAPIVWLDLSSAVNKEPWPIPTISPEKWMALPDLYQLNQAASVYYGRPNGLAVSGTQQAIEWLPVILPQVTNAFLSRKSIKVMLPDVGYQEHTQAWEKWGYEVEYYHSLAELLSISWNIVVVITPNNPTAEWAENTVLDQLASLAKKRSGYLLVDEAFIDSTPQNSLLNQEITVNWPDELIVLRSVGKFFGLAGARVGFCFASNSVLNALKQVVGPWPIATVSAHIVTCALQDTQWQKQANVSLITRQARFQRSIEPLLNRWFECLGGKFYWRRSHFFFSVFFDGNDEIDVFKALQNQGVHTRLGDGWLRIALPETEAFSLLEERIGIILDNALLKNKGKIE
ncbi:aminotransferase class I/II-fold pyridoxal phosphate-dependent enzyme [Marinomonas sp. 2405UD68-3]|uniref:aminotransferase class I/II-fold pyridoxal phosphate-dependent enzyme n=1 Tax=Marinomonas sp. 2405UD68-3 TaxID=3391835 RepID=UPI0039C9210C